MILNAEQAVLDNHYNKADELYKEAIVYTGRTGHLHHAALCVATKDMLTTDCYATMSMMPSIKFRKRFGITVHGEQSEKPRN